MATTKAELGVRGWAACAAALLLGALASAPAQACRYPLLTAAQQLARADLVFLGRAGPLRAQGARGKQLFSVLHVIKGEAVRSYELDYELPPNTCVSTYTPGQLAVVLVRQHAVRVPDGNLPIEAQLPRLHELLRGGGRRPDRAPELEAFRAAFAAALTPYLHARPGVPVVYRPHAGKALSIGETSLRFEAAAPRRTRIEVPRALAVGPVRLISGFYPAEGYAFDVLLLRQADGSGFEVLGHWGRERSARPPPR